MTLVERTFRLNQKLRLPSDTVIVEPQPSVATTESRFVFRIFNNASAGCGACSTDNETTAGVESAEDQFLAVSTSKASYVVLRKRWRKAFQALVDGASLKRAQALLAQSDPDPESAMREILTAILVSNFLEDATTSETLPDGAILHFYVTNRCNLRCEHCYMSSGLPLDRELNSSEKLRALELFASLYPHGQVTFSGGEALATPDIFDLLKTARQLGLRVQLYTNGVMIRPTNVSEIIRLVNILQISLDGATAAVNDRIRGAGTFNKIVKAIKLVNSQLKRDTFSLRIAMTLTPSNADDIESHLGDLLSELKLTGNYNVSIGSATNLGRAQGNGSLFSTIGEMRALEARVIHGLAKQGVLTLPVLHPNRLRKSCGHGGAITLHADGSIYPCSITDQPALGNVRDPNALAVMTRVRDYITSSNVDNIEGCNRCAIRYFCGGICRVTNFSRTGSYNISGCTPEYKNSQIRTLIHRYQSFRLGGSVQ
jgi:radical SAM protein with 4Fe4S-binding SPASM domain